MQNSIKRNEKDEKVKGKRNVPSRKQKTVKTKDNKKNKKIDKKDSEFKNGKKKSAHKKNGGDLFEHDEL